MKMPDVYTILDLKTLDEAVTHTLNFLAEQYGFDRVYFQIQTSTVTRVPRSASPGYPTSCKLTSENVEFEYNPNKNELEILTPLEVQVSVPHASKGGPSDKYFTQTSEPLSQQMIQLLAPVLQSAVDQINASQPTEQPTDDDVDDVDYTDSTPQTAPQNNFQNVEEPETTLQSGNLSNAVSPNTQEDVSQGEESNTEPEVEEGTEKATSWSMGTKILIGAGVLGVLAITAMEFMENAQQTSRRRRY